MPPIQREISPALNATVEQYLRAVPSEVRAAIEEIRRQKVSGDRPYPSAVLLDSSSIFTSAHRGALLDRIAALVDENLSGRSDMCQQFADLLNRALVHLNFPSRPVAGWAMYFSPAGEELFRWRHAWVRVGDEVIDGNTDIVFENPLFPACVTAAPYWGPIKGLTGRRLREDHGDSLPDDTDVVGTWWPDLRAWLDTDFLMLSPASAVNNSV